MSCMRVWLTVALVAAAGDLSVSRSQVRPVDLALVAAAEAGDAQRIGSLVEQGADIDARDDRGVTPLMVTALSLIHI